MNGINVSSVHIRITDFMLLLDGRDQMSIDRLKSRASEPPDGKLEGELHPLLSTIEAPNLGCLSTSNGTASSAACGS